MAISDADVTLAIIVSGLLALGTVAAVMMTAPSYSVGAGRIRLMLKIMCRTIIAAGVIVGIGMLAWGVVTRSEGLMYFSMAPLVAALLTSNFMTRSGLR